MIAWRDGLEESPGGPAREVVQRHVWSSSVCITPHGEAFRRYRNPVTRRCTWEAMPVSLDQDTQSRLGLPLPSGWMSIETAIATAWLHRAPGSRAYVKHLDPREPTLPNLRWGEMETDPEAGEFERETWASLRWHCGQIACDARYRISSQGRLMSPNGDVTHGFAALGSRWAACKGSGLVDLLQAAGIMRAETRIPERVYFAYNSLSSSLPVAEHAQRHALSLRTAWQYYQLAAPHVHDLRLYAQPLVPPALWRALESLRGDPVLGGRLADLHVAVTRLTGGEVLWDELRFARMCVM
jgi:hypothetical protein